MKIFAAILSTALLAAPALGRGRGGGKSATTAGKSGKGKGKSAAEDTCGCIAPSVVVVDGNATTPMIMTVEDAVRFVQSLLLVFLG